MLGGCGEGQADPGGQGAWWDGRGGRKGGGKSRGPPTDLRPVGERVHLLHRGWEATGLSTGNGTVTLFSTQGHPNCRVHLTVAGERGRGGDWGGERKQGAPANAIPIVRGRKTDTNPSVRSYFC